MSLDVSRLESRNQHWVGYSVSPKYKERDWRIKTMTNADLVPEVGLRDYSLELTDGSYIELRF